MKVFNLKAMKVFNLKQWLLLFLCTHIIFPSLSMADDLSDELLVNINKFRQDMKLPVLTQNENAACLAKQIADQFKGQVCSNSTGEDTVPGTEPQFPNYPQFLENCHLNVSDTKDGVVMPDCVPGLDPQIAFQNYTHSQYIQNVNDTKFVSAGIASEDNWFVLVLATNTTGGNFQTYNRGTMHYINKLLSLLPILGALLLAA
ncbi:hypothetical protein SUGI_0176150 [Cryptomeria japonica]|uniref:uncharacterized GPI-anchored protein At3g06035 n=1 Tax=Cryptomeria japonica TaxID=3369 RepID=UPI002408D4AC|nr:uncharacterized GPI-anchored protein At3g06035 [Cryptomeria japonica]GLJ11754.1 hypothetical protein SUGI_0176150 [Cryptomeria japonica]